MAQTLKSDEERKERVLLVGTLVKETGLSTRKLAAYITDNFFPISNCTVSDYMKRYCKLKPDEIDIIKEKIRDNTAATISKPEVKQRVERNVSLFEQGFTVEEIANSSDESFWTVYRDITSRIRALDPDRYESSIKPRLDENRIANLKK